MCGVQLLLCGFFCCRLTVEQLVEKHLVGREAAPNTAFLHHPLKKQLSSVLVCVWCASLCVCCVHRCDGDAAAVSSSSRRHR